MIECPHCGFVDSRDRTNVFGTICLSCKRRINSDKVSFEEVSKKLKKTREEVRELLRRNYKKGS